MEFYHIFMKRENLKWFVTKLVYGSCKNRVVENDARQEDNFSAKTKPLISSL